MSKITPETVLNVAHLSRLNVESSQVDYFVEGLSKIINLIDQMNRVATDNVLPLAHPLEVQQRMREDKVTEGNQRQVLQKNAAQVEAGFYLVPKVIE